MRDHVTLDRGTGSGAPDHSTAERRRGLIGCALAALLLAAQPALAQIQPLEITTESLPEATRLFVYQNEDATPVVLQASGGSLPYSWSLNGGDFPPGLFLTINGTISGIPDQCGLFFFQVQVQDDNLSFANRNFVLEVGGPPGLVLPTMLDITAEAGTRTTTTVDLTNDGCSDVAFFVQSLETFTPLAADAVRQPESGDLATLMEMGAPIPRTLGRWETPPMHSSEGWFVTGDGLLADGEGNLAAAGFSLAPTGLLDPQGSGSILYVNESNTEGERERLEALGFTVVQSLVPQILDLDVLRAFNVLWLTAATTSALPSKDAINQYVWEGGGLVITQVQETGTVPLLPPGYSLSVLSHAPPGDINALEFTPEAGSDPLTAGLTTDDLAANFDSSILAESGFRWSWLAFQEDTPELGTLATASLGGGNLVYHTGNLGDAGSPNNSMGSDVYVERLALSAGSGSVQVSCPWMQPGEAFSDVRVEEGSTNVVGPFDTLGETVILDLNIDATRLAPGVVSCDVFFLTDDELRPTLAMPLRLTVTAPVALTILNESLRPAEPGQPYTDTINVAGGTPPYTLAEKTAGTLPAGLQLDPGTCAPVAGTGCVVFGNPTEGGLFEPVFVLTDAIPDSTEKTLPISSGLVITTESLPDGIIGAPYSVPLLTQGGIPPFHFEMDPEIDYQLPTTDPNAPAAQACVTMDLGGGNQSTDCTVPSGTYRIFFDPVDGFFLPPTLDVEVSVGGNTVVDGDYKAFASITVTVDHSEATYTLDGDTTQGPFVDVGSGLSTTFVDLPPGDYTIFFDPIGGFITPPADGGTLVEGGSLDLNGSYVVVPGGITVTTSEDAATFMLDGPAGGPSVPRFGGGPRTTFVDLPPGDYTVTFDPLAGFGTPAPQGGTLGLDSGLAFHGDYLVVTPAVSSATDSQVAVDGLATEAEIGFGDGTLTVTTDATGASFQILGNRLPSLLTLAEPAGMGGSAAALSGIMGTVVVPVLAPEQKVSFNIVVEDSVGNRFRRTYSPTVWLRPDVNLLSPNTGAQTLEQAVQVFGASLRETATLDLGAGVTVESAGVVSAFSTTNILSRIFKIAADATPDIRDVIYDDPDLAATGAGTVRLPNSYRIFVEVSRLDVDDNGRLDGFDLAIVSRGFGTSDPTLDFNSDGIVDGNDLASVSIAFGRNTLAFDDTALPLPPGVIGTQYEMRLPFIGGNLFIDARILEGVLPDGMDVFIDPCDGDDLDQCQNEPEDTVLVILGIPAETGTFDFTVQVSDAFFAIDVRPLSLVIGPRTGP